MPSLEDLLGYNHWANQLLLDLVDRASADGLAASQPGMYGSVIDTLRHLVSVETNFLRIICGQPTERITTSDPAELGARLLPLGVEYVAALAAETNLERPVLVPWFDAEISMADAIVQPVTHSIQHRADIVAALSREGIEPPPLDYIRWVLDGRPTSPSTVMSA